MRKRAIREAWNVIPKFPNYSVSNFGEVINNTTEKTIRSTTGGGEGAPQVCLRTPWGKSKTRYVHRLVAAEFLVDWDPELTVEFKNGDKTDCCVLNLRMGEKKARGPHLEQ